nr:hypothetical protein [Nocardia neocaledoniensis]
MVLDEVWRGLTGVEALSGPQGGPLRRTVKLILDPLVIRPVQHPLCAGTVLSPDGVALLTSLVLARSDALRACAAWFTELKQARRALRITEGNAQDLYFQRCFELATMHGAPGPDARTRAEAVLREVHDSTGGRTTAALKDHVTEPDRRAELSALVDLAWGRRPLADFGARDHAPALTELLEASTLAYEGDPADAGPLLDELLDDKAGTHRGIALWRHHPAYGADDLGLTVHTHPQRPDLGATASTATLALPFDRTVYERVFTVLQGSIDRSDLPAIPELVTTEITRSCSPWGLLDESLRLTAAVGCELALGLSPLGPAVEFEHGEPPMAAAATPPVLARSAEYARADREAWSGSANRGRPTTSGGQAAAWPTATVTESAGPLQAAPGSVGSFGRGDRVETGRDDGAHRSAGTEGIGANAPETGQSRAHEVVNGRWRREAYVLQARRFAVGTGANGPLAAVAGELRTPWRPYLRRLWVRLHGRDVRDMPVFEPGELWDLLDGVARSVMLDHRARVKQALTVAATSAVPESRAS